jgi:hypothetical protein
MARAVRVGGARTPPRSLGAVRFCPPPSELNSPAGAEQRLRGHFIDPHVSRLIVPVVLPQAVGCRAHDTEPLLALPLAVGPHRITPAVGSRHGGLAALAAPHKPPRLTRPLKLGGRWSHARTARAVEASRRSPTLAEDGHGSTGLGAQQ